MYGKGFLGNMAENLQADYVQSCQAGFVRCCLKAGISGRNLSDFFKNAYPLL